MLHDICINFHSHNNYQLSFAFAQEVIKLSGSSSRQIIIDGTLGGIGKVAGNLNTELIRIAYVAMTRPRKLLVVSVPKTKTTLSRFSTALWDYQEL